MAFSKRLKYSFLGDGESFEYETVYSGGLAVRVQEPIAGSSTNVELKVPLLLAGLQCLVISAGVGMTIKTNSSGAPDDTLVLVANVPYVWRIDGGVANLITHDITSLFVTVAGSVAGELRIEAIADPTPPA